MVKGTRLRQLRLTKGFCDPCKRNRDEAYECNESTERYKSITTQQIYLTRPENLKCSYELVDNLLTCEWNML